jgi:hypothetical protein
MSNILVSNYISVFYLGVYGGAVCWHTALKAGRSRVLFQTVLMDFFRPHSDPEVESASKSSKYLEYLGEGGGEKGSRCVALTNVSPSCTDCLEIWKSQHSETPNVCLSPLQGLRCTPPTHMICRSLTYFHYVYDPTLYNLPWGSHFCFVISPHMLFNP